MILSVGRWSKTPLSSVTAGERVFETHWVVRGFNSYTKVEVFFADSGWISFEPKPSDPREAAGEGRLETARMENESGVDTSQTRLTGTPSSSATTANRPYSPLEIDTAPEIETPSRKFFTRARSVPVVLLF